MPFDIDPSELVLVRALWGDSSIAYHDKVLWDIEHRTPRYTSNMANAMRQVVVAYGKCNTDWLYAHGYGDQIIEASDEPPPCYDYKANMRRKRHGAIRNGISMLWRKLDALRIAFESTKTRAVLFLDWDTIVEKRPDAELLHLLNNRPVFQGRKQFAPKCTVPWRPDGRLRSTIYVGGCYYFRDQDLLADCIQCHAEMFAGDSDEFAVTYVIDKSLGMDTLIDNDQLYVSAMGMPKRNCSPYFRHGRLISLKRYKQIMAKDQWALGWLRSGLLSSYDPA